MFSLFTRNKSSWRKDVELLLNVFNALPGNFDYIINQINEGLIKGIRKLDNPIKNLNKVLFDVKILNKYENKKIGFFSIKGVKAFDLITQSYVEIVIYISSNILLGYAIPKAVKVNLDVSKIKVDNFRMQQMENDDYDKIKPLFKKAELELINPNEVYEVQLNGKTYYHLEDLEDGDFIGVDIGKNLYKITHDPFEITLLKADLSEILKSKSV